MPSLNWASQPWAMLAASSAAAGGRYAVLGALAVRVEGREHRAVVQLHRVEIAVRHRSQPLARAALLRRQHLGEGGIVSVLRRIAERRGKTGLAVTTVSTSAMRPSFTLRRMA